MKRHVKLLNLGTLLILLLGLAASPALVQPAAASSATNRIGCEDGSPTCTELVEPYNYEGQYVGHDEPSVLFYSNTSGSGNNNVYTVTLPKDPPTLPTQDGKGGTFNFELHPAFWFGMALCDTQSAPNPGIPCTPDSDANIFDSADPTSPSYMGNHPGGAYMEMQFYPPGWVPWPLGNSCDGSKWCAALNIDSLSENQNTGQIQNSNCLAIAGIEPVNFAFITKSGLPQAPANPVQATAATYTPDPTRDLFMNSGDKLTLSMHDTAHGFQVQINDLTTGESGSMTASAANSFGQVQFDPTGTSCNVIPYDFHPMYATSSEHTRLPWTAHSYNIAFSDEIGHFEFCDKSNPNFKCTQAGVNDPSGTDSDDTYCLDASMSTSVQVGGCLATDTDFDGVPYKKVWPGTLQDLGQDQAMHPTSVLFTSPTFMPSVRTTGQPKDYSRVAFEADLPRIELNVNPPCNRTTGANCTNPPLGADFYPFFSTAGAAGACAWQLGGAYIPGTTNTFGGSSTAEFGPLLKLTYPSVGGPVSRYNDFRQVLGSNPCPVGS